MRKLVWVSVATVGLLALMSGLYFHYWLDDAWPESVLFYGQRLSVLLVLGGALALAAAASLCCVIVEGRPRDTLPPPS